MATTSESLGKTIELLFDIAIFGAEKTYKKISASASIYLKAFYKGIAVWLMVVIASIFLKAYTGMVGFAYVGVTLCVVLGVAILALASPLGIIIGMIKEETVNPTKPAEAYVKFILSFVLMMLMAFLYVIRMPIENNPGVLPILIICWIALNIVIYLRKKQIPLLFYAVVLSATMLYTSLTLFGIKPLDYIFKKTYSTYQGQVYEPNQEIDVHNKKGEFSEIVTLNGYYEPMFLGQTEFLSVDSGKITTVQVNQDFNIPSNTFRIRNTPFGKIKLIPKNR